MGEMIASTKQVRELQEDDLGGVTGGASMSQYDPMSIVVATLPYQPGQSALGELFNTMVTQVQKAAGGTPR